MTAALEAARAAWPEEHSTGRLLARLAAAGAATLPTPKESREARRARFARLAGHRHTLTDAQLAQLRDEWPA